MSEEARPDTSEFHRLSMHDWERILSRAGRLYSALPALAAALACLSTAYLVSSSVLDVVQWVISTAVVIASTGRWIVRVPRSALRAPDFEPPRLYKEIVGTIGVRAPRLVIYGPTKRTTVQLRGGRLNPTVMISPRTVALWDKDEQRKYVQIVHELSHCIANDSHRYGRITGSLLVAFGFFATFLGVSRSVDRGSVIYFAVLLLVGLLGWRAYSRFRESTADFVAVTLMGSHVLDVLPDGDPSAFSLDTRFPLIGTHPSTRQRRATLLDPGQLFRGFKWGFLGFGILIAALSQALGAGLSTFLEATVYMTRLSVWSAVAVLIVVVVGSALHVSALLVGDSGAEARRTYQTWFRWFLVGSYVAALLLDRQDWHDTSLILVCVLAAIFAASPLAAVTGMASLSILSPRYLQRRVLVVLYGVPPAVAWVGMRYLLVEGHLHALARRLDGALPFA